MSISDPKHVNKLNELAQLCTNSADAYQRAMQTVQSPELAAFCKRCAAERKLLAGQFRLRVDRLGEPVTEGGYIRGFAERIWTEAKSLIGDDEKAILDELVQIDGVLKERAEAFLASGASAELDSVLKQFLDRLTGSYRELCHEAK